MRNVKLNIKTSQVKKMSKILSETFFGAFLELSGVFETFAKFKNFPGILGTFREFQELSGNFRKFPELSGNLKKFPGISGTFQKFQEF